jgi:hypothetical protein
MAGAARAYSEYYKNNSSTPDRRIPESEEEDRMAPGSMPKGKKTKPGMSIPKPPRKDLVAAARKKALQNRLKGSRK